MKKIKETAKVISQERLTGDIYSMWIDTKTAYDAKPGQFISVYTKSDARLLPRPLSICEINREKTALRIVYRIAGKGTDEFSTYESNEEISVMGPLGNGYPLLCDKAILIGGGIGIPPLLELAKNLNCDKTIVLGYRDELFLNKEFAKYGRVVIATESGRYGTRGNVIDAIKEQSITGSVIYSCGPIPMLRGVKNYASENKIRAYISMEERMACGVGACLSCVCKSTDTDEHSKVNNKRVCADGPVFNAEDIDI